MKKCIDELLNNLKNDLKIEPHDRVGLVFTNTNNIKINFSINISFRPFNQYAPEVVLQELENIIQSNSKFFIDDNLIINVDHVKVPVGYGRRTYIGKSTHDYFNLHQKSIFNPLLNDNDNHLCLAVSIVVAMAHSSVTRISSIILHINQIKTI